jgi:hypothetical protein
VTGSGKVVRFGSMKRKMAAMYTVLAVLLTELVALYLLGSYAMGRLGALGWSGGPLWRLGFYLVVVPGVILHESAHYLACRLTLTPVQRFVPFSPKLDAGSGRVVLGYVAHRRTNPLSGAVIGLAPMLLNPLVLLLLTVSVTPVNPLALLPAIVSGGASPGEVLPVLGGGLWNFARAQPSLFGLWVYLAVSLSLGSCPSRENLAAVPAAAGLVLAGALSYAAVSGASLPQAFTGIPALAASLYLFPVLVAAAAALAVGLLRG